MIQSIVLLLKKTQSFDRIRITSPIERVVGDEADTTTDYTQLLREVVFTFPKMMKS